MGHAFILPCVGAHMVRKAMCTEYMLLTIARKTLWVGYYARNKGRGTCCTSCSVANTLVNTIRRERDGAENNTVGMHPHKALRHIHPSENPFDMLTTWLSSACSKYVGEG